MFGGLAKAARDVVEYAPTQVKLALTGSGRAEKMQVQHMVKVLLNLQGRMAIDASDALAIALTHAQVRGVRERMGLAVGKRWSRARSEEHTSELQSLMRISYAVFCLNKKKQKLQILQQHQTQTKAHK